MPRSVVRVHLSLVPVEYSLFFYSLFKCVALIYTAFGYTAFRYTAFMYTVRSSGFRVVLDMDDATGDAVSHRWLILNNHYS